MSGTRILVKAARPWASLSCPSARGWRTARLTCGADRGFDLRFGKRRLHRLQRPGAFPPLLASAALQFALEHLLDRLGREQAGMPSFLRQAVGQVQRQFQRGPSDNDIVAIGFPSMCAVGRAEHAKGRVPMFGMPNMESSDAYGREANRCASAIAMWRSSRSNERRLAQDSRPELILVSGY
ncbi:MAG TPA: hypothetical protein VFA81_00230 [Burkholderiales bacterium]|nr:hypothetical protein [Burkholderiales bacterium]